MRCALSSVWHENDRIDKCVPYQVVFKALGKWILFRWQPWPRLYCDLALSLTLGLPFIYTDMDSTAQIFLREQDTVYSLMNFLVYNFQAFIKQRNYPAHVPVTKVPESGEPSEFKALFKQWDIMRTSAQMKAYSNNKIG